jgi:hypothetical protein
MGYGSIEEDNPIRIDGENAMTRKKSTRRRINLEEIDNADKDSFKELLQGSASIGLGTGNDRSARGQRREKCAPAVYGFGFYKRSLVTRVGKIKLRIPQGSARTFFHPAL